ILATPQPSDKYEYLQFVWRYGQAMAHLRGGDIEASNADLDEMRALAVSDGVRKSRVRQVNSMIEIAIGVVKGEIAAATGDYDAAIDALNVARGIEDGLSYRETRTWPHPVQITMGRIFADAGRLDEAEAALLENLTESPENGWALFQLSRVYQLQGKGTEADAVLARYQKAWEFADRTVLEGK
ncbi:MAG: tetratricopeptide repeat protein, partial [Armatimonadetes bacterium]|nr:tetratricopeptide repeat protein [Armatimonadota bacterium]